jgi:hypothetical protein
VQAKLFEVALVLLGGGACSESDGSASATTTLARYQEWPKCGTPTPKEQQTNFINYRHRKVKGRRLLAPTTRIDGARARVLVARVVAMSVSASTTLARLQEWARRDAPMVGIHFDQSSTSITGTGMP